MSLPATIEQTLASFVDSAKAAFQSDLRAVVLFGSAATEQLRPSSDVNLLVLLSRFGQDGADALREPMRIAHASIGLHAMFVLESELDAAAEAFAVKFADIIARHRVLYGADPFESLRTSREALCNRLRQVLLNHQLRLRERYVLVSLREEQLVPLIADSAAPLRASAATLLQLEGGDAQPGKQALETIVGAMGEPDLLEAVHAMSAARESEALAPGRAVPAVMALIRITEHLRERASRLR